MVYVLCMLVYLDAFSHFNIHSFMYQKKKKVVETNTVSS